MSNVVMKRAAKLEVIGRIINTIHDGNLMSPQALVERFAEKTFNVEERKVLSTKIKLYKDTGKIGKFHPTSLSLVLLEGVESAVA